MAGILANTSHIKLSASKTAKVKGYKVSGTNEKNPT